MQPEIIDPQLSRIEDDRLREEAWRQVISPAFIPQIDRSVPFPRDIAFRCYKVGNVLLSSMKAGPQTIERTKTQISTQAIDHVVLRLYTSGASAIDTGDGEAPIRPGTFVLFDLAQRARSISSGMAGLNLVIPRRLLDGRVGEVANLHRGTFGPERGPLFTLLADHLRNAERCLDATDAEQRNLLSAATLALVGAALTPASDSARNRPAVVAIEIRQFIEANLARADLDVEMLCARFGLSRKPVYALFEADGGVMTYIRNRRLARAMRMLSGLEGVEPRRISSVAYACGYENLKSFSKAFHARYGIVPREVDPSFRVGAQWDLAEQSMSWVRDL